MTFFTGPMFCGKTLELVRHLQVYAAQKIPTVCIRPETDDRSPKIQSRSGLSYDGLTIPDQDVATLKNILENYRVIGLDEVQFFSADIVPILHQAMKNGHIILLSGLDTDFRGQMFPTSAALFSLPETKIQRLQAVCSVCHEHAATRTQRLKNGQPVPSHEPIIAVEHTGADITYEPRCINHHIFIETGCPQET